MTEIAWKHMDTTTKRAAAVPITAMVMSICMGISINTGMNICMGMNMNTGISINTGISMSISIKKIPNVQMPFWQMA